MLTVHTLVNVLTTLNGECFFKSGFGSNVLKYTKYKLFRLLVRCDKVLLQLNRDAEKQDCLNQYIKLGIGEHF